MGKIAVVIPAANEEKVIGKTLKSLNPIVPKKDIYVISDASIDKTGKITYSFGVNYTRTRKRNGKIKNLKKALNKFSILKTYQFVFFLDADSQPMEDFFKNALKRFNDKNVVCVCGQVVPETKMNIFVAYRSIMYFVWQNIYKKFLSIFNAITIAPGTASLYRSSALKKIEFDERLIIEDFDLTYQIYRKNLGKIVYEPGAKVITQDPDNFKDYFKQLTRWQLGFLQSILKHRVPFGFKSFDLAVAILLTMDIIHLIFLVVILPLSIWLYSFALYPSIFGIYIVNDAIYTIVLFEILLFLVLSTIYFLLSHKFYVLIFGPFLWILQYINILVLIKALYLTIFKSVHGNWITPKRR